MINSTNHNDHLPSECKDQTEEKVAEVTKPENQLDLGVHTKTPKDLVSPEDIDCNESADDEVSEEDSLVNLLLGSASSLEERLAALQLLTSNTMDEFNDLLSRQNFTAEQLKTCRDIRRRGKNKLTAENSRKRKFDLVKDLEERYQEARKRGQQLELELAESRARYLEDLLFVEERQVTIRC